MPSKSLRISNYLFSLLFVLTIIGVYLSIPSKSLAMNGVDDLRGRWDFKVEGLEPQPVDFIVYIGNIELYSENRYVANGCMESPSGKLSPLAMIAEYEGEGQYSLNLISTVLTNTNHPYVIQFLGPVSVFGQGVADDIAGGSESIIRTEFFNGGKWTALHHDRRIKNCPPVEIPPLNFYADVRANVNLNDGEEITVKTIFEAQTNIVSSGVVVTKPDGTTVLITPYTDIYSPYVDFVSTFRFLIPWDTADEGYPETGSPYFFTLLDILGQPIPGATQSDVWTGCYIDAPRNVMMEILENKDIELVWDDVETTDGFNPSNDEGFYQIAIDGINPRTPTLYGSNLIKSNWHIVPWEDFTSPSHGNPDGYDLGVGLSQFNNGDYQVRLIAFSEPPSGSGGYFHECEVTDTAENVFFNKLDNVLKTHYSIFHMT